MSQPADIVDTNVVVAGLLTGNDTARVVPNVARILDGMLAAAFPLPPLATPQTIVAEIEAEQALVAANRELITRFEKKIQATLARVWGEDEPPLANDSASIHSELPAADRSTPAVAELLPH